MKNNNSHKDKKHRGNDSYLVLSRRVDERIFIGDDIEVLISDIKPDRVRVAIKAPKGIVILRDNCKDKTARG